MKLTKTQRAEIYLEVAEIFANGEDMYGFACYELDMMLGRRYGYDRYGENDSYMDMLEKFFPEFLLFKNVNAEKWFFDDAQARIIALLLSHQMCKD